MQWLRIFNILISIQLQSASVAFDMCFILLRKDNYPELLQQNLKKQSMSKLMHDFKVQEKAHLTKFKSKTGDFSTQIFLVTF
jgi:hypothetical protein